MSSWIPDELDPENDQTREVYAHAGLALYMAQVLEHGLANVILLARAGSPEFRSSQDYNDALDELLSKTMGEQLRRALELVDFTDEQMSALRDALKKRNFLVHDFFQERIDEFGSVAGKNRMIVELDEIRDALKNIDAEVQEITVGFWAKHGVTREMLQAEVDKMIAESRDRP